MKMNPIALELWIFVSSCGYILGGTAKSAVVGLAIGTGLSLFVDLFSKNR